MARLHAASADAEAWRDRLSAEVGDGFPEKVTAFRPGMAVHGRYGQPCPVCGTPVQRIRYADNEANYCPGCQTGGRLLADGAVAACSRATGRDRSRNSSAASGADLTGSRARSAAAG